MECIYKVTIIHAFQTVFYGWRAIILMTFYLRSNGGLQPHGIFHSNDRRRVIDVVIMIVV